MAVLDPGVWQWALCGAQLEKGPTQGRPAVCGVSRAWGGTGKRGVGRAQRKVFQQPWGIPILHLREDESEPVGD